MEKEEIHKIREQFLDEMVEAILNKLPDDPEFVKKFMAIGQGTLGNETTNLLPTDTP